VNNPKTKSTDTTLFSAAAYKRRAAPKKSVFSSLLTTSLCSIFHLPPGRPEKSPESLFVFPLRLLQITPLVNERTIYSLFVFQFIIVCMAIRVTFSFSGYVAQNIAASAGARAGNCRASLTECWIRSRIFATPSNQSVDSEPKKARGSFQPSHRTHASMYSTIVAEALGDSSRSPIASGLISLVKSTAGISFPSSSASVFGISPVKAGSILPFLQGSRWLPCNAPPVSPKSREVDKIETAQAAENKATTRVTQFPPLLCILLWI
ncbi:hypothetical protein LINPERPRIM_LOCUS15200, partial [Linum perenne]